MVKQQVAWMICGLRLWQAAVWLWVSRRLARAADAAARVAHRLIKHAQEGQR